METPPFLLATREDATGLNFETTIAGAASANHNDLGTMYQHAADGDFNNPATRLAVFLASVLGMHMAPRERRAPFRPMYVLSDGSRSAELADFKNHADLLADLADRAANPVLKARLADVGWLHCKRHHELASMAIEAYLDVVEGIEAGRLSTMSEAQPKRHPTQGLEFAVAGLLRRAMYIVMEIGKKPNVANRFNDVLTRLRLRSRDLSAAYPLVWFSELTLECGSSLPADVAADIEVVVSAKSDDDADTKAALWSMAARAWKKAGRADEQNRCLTAAAEALVDEAKQLFNAGGSAMQAAAIMHNAIAQMLGIPGSTARRQELQKLLVEMQSRIPDEMSTWTMKLDTQPITGQVAAWFSGKSLLDQLFGLSELDTIWPQPEPDELAAKAREAAKETPLLSLLSSNKLDSEGKIIHRSPGAMSDAPNAGLVTHMSMLESERRHKVAVAVEAAREVIAAEWCIPEEALLLLMLHSPFVPPELTGTYSRGFLRFFQGDFPSAMYILVSLVESSVRHLLKQRPNVDVTRLYTDTQTQEDLPLSALYKNLREEFDEIFGKALSADIGRVFLDHPGPRLRHNLAHGQMHDGSSYGADAIYGCWLIFKLCLAPLYPAFDSLRQSLEKTGVFR